MPNGERQRGFTWPGLLLLLAVTGAGLAALGQGWSLQAQRGREAELRFRGEQIRDAIARYHAAQVPAQWPPSLQALLEDRREGLPGGPRHHLRRLWPDPFTGSADWVLVPAPAPAVGIAGVHSRSDVPLLATAALGPLAPGERPLASDWRFVHAAAAALQTSRTESTP